MSTTAVRTGTPPTMRERLADLGIGTVPYLMVIPGLIFVLGVLGYAVAGGF